MTSVEQLVGEFVDAWNAGRRPGVDTYLALASESDRDELAAQLSAWLDIAPTPAYDAATRAEITAEPLLVAARARAAELSRPLAERLPTLRERAGIAIADVAARLNERFEIGDATRTEQYVTALESGDFDERRLSQRLLDGLASILGVDSGALAPSPAAGGHALFRAEEDADLAIVRSLDVLSEAAFAQAPAAPMDELDRLFRGGPAA